MMGGLSVGKEMKFSQVLISNSVVGCPGVLSRVLSLVSVALDPGEWQPT